MKVLRAEHVLPISEPPITNGAVVVDGGAIIDVGESKAIVKRFPQCPVEDFGRAAILPGLVNCHSHLEITSMRGLLDPVEHDFRKWLIELNSIRAQLTDEDIGHAAVAGAIEGARAGVTCFGDVGRMGTAGLNALKSVGLRGVVFQETEFSPDNTSADRDFGRLTEKFYATRENATELVDMGLSPHSPYSVSRELFEKIARFALDEDIRVSVHAAESTAEDALVREGIGFFIDIYKKFGVEWEVPGCSSIEFLSRTGLLETRPLLVHCVAVTDSDLRLLAESGSRIAHCPKSNAKFGHGVAPFESFLDAGIAVGLGSDSVASNNVCDLFEEARFAALAARNRAGNKRFISAAEMLEAATLGGARSLGLDHKIGTLEAGKAADITAVSLDAMAQQPDNDVCSTLVFASNARDVVMTMVEGEEIYRDGVMKKADEAETIAALDRIKGREH